MPPSRSQRHSRLIFYQPRLDRPFPAWMLFPVFFSLVYLTHARLLRLPYYWDEAGYYIPAAYDFFKTGSLIPHTTLTNAHPPLPAVLLASWWHFAGFVPSATRTFMCFVTAIALLGVYEFTRAVTNVHVAVATTLLTGLYPIWFAQSTLAHADMFAVAASIWALLLYVRSVDRDRVPWGAAGLFAVAALCKETAIVTPLALAAMAWTRAASGDTRDAKTAKGVPPASEPRSTATETWARREGAAHPAPGARKLRTDLLLRGAVLCLPVLPLLCWYAYHRAKTGFMFGNPEFLRYNAGANLTPLRFVVALGHRIFHAALHMNMFVPVLCMLAAMFLHPLPGAAGAGRPAARYRGTMLVVIAANLLLFSVLGGALLTRYLLLVYPLVLLAAVSTFWRRVPHWWLLGLLSAVAFVAGIFVNPPYRFAPEDNLAYRDTIVLQQQAVAALKRLAPNGTILTAWPASDELTKPELGYVKQPMHVTEIKDFSFGSIQAAADDPGGYDTALIFSTKYAPERLPLSLGRWNDDLNRKYFGLREDLSPEAAAKRLGGRVVWEQQRNGWWAAILQFDRAVEAQLHVKLP